MYHLIISDDVEEKDVCDLLSNQREYRKNYEQIPPEIFFLSYNSG